MGRGGRGARVSEFFSKNPNLKKEYIFFWAGWAERRGGLGLLIFFFRESNSKFFLLAGGGGGELE